MDTASLAPALVLVALVLLPTLVGALASMGGADTRDGFDGRSW